MAIFCLGLFKPYRYANYKSFKNVARENRKNYGEKQTVWKIVHASDRFDEAPRPSGSVGLRFIKPQSLASWYVTFE